MRCGADIGTIGVWTIMKITEEMYILRTVSDLYVKFSISTEVTK